MSFKEILKDLKDSEVFKDWSIENPTAYICNCFNIDEGDWQFCFYSPTKDNITTFSNKQILESDSEIFRKEKDAIKKLNIENIRIDLPQALEIFENINKKKYSKEKPTKKIVILQKLNVPTWNITYLISFNILNIKIDAITGRVISENLNSVMDFKAK
jgi:hypothetical protein